jgi:hypothetical protein
MSATDPQLGKMGNLRRSQRVYVSVEVVVAFKKANEKVSAERTKTIVVNAHGALILLRTAVKIGELLTLKNTMTEEERSCRIVDLGSSAESETIEVGVEFLEPAPKFWRVAFPPANWTPRCAEAKGHRPQIAAQPASKEK